ncbi:hypothetical protein FH972_027305 [Carpinus fangiana]|uniref:Uncharacterized protein n=1 Tax=Carpinus fangiana TaxID=176857 RepID=A0A5N6N1G6_9ROSI|nr:hypothetical protein FH972_027305 [Carpinus fangiana]
MSNEIHTKDTVEDTMEDIFQDDVVELNPTQEPSGSQCISKKRWTLDGTAGAEHSMAWGGLGLPSLYIPVKNNRMRGWYNGAGQFACHRRPRKDKIHQGVRFPV